jgi:hypothetical protein
LDAKVKLESKVQETKQELQRISTDAGTSIDRTDEQFENADSPIRVS